MATESRMQYRDNTNIGLQLDYSH